jgi:NADH dehydrogenase/NADH:ubiquinone oxidoreductase subunit G
VKRITLNIDGKEVTGEEGMTILQVARAAGIDIPTLCYHDKLEPYGACRLCLVEIGTPPRTRLVVSCVYPVADGLVVKTRSERVIQTRKVLLELLLARAPGAKRIKDLAEEYGIARARLRKTATFCILCGLCVRYCAEIKKADAIGFIGRGIEREVMFIPEIAAKSCPPCRECFPLCPTGVLESNFGIAQSLLFGQ